MENLRSAEEARILQDLLADAHARIRNLQSHVEQLSDELLTLQVNDRRGPAGSHGDVGQERRRPFVHAIGWRKEQIEPSW
jgi:hypothetical protein